MLNINDLGISLVDESGNERDICSPPNWPVDPAVKKDLVSDLEDEISAFPYVMPDEHSPIVGDMQSALDFPEKAPDLTPLRRIFPKSLMEQQSGLYAYILGNMCLGSIISGDGDEMRMGMRSKRKAKGLQSDLLRCVHSLVKQMEDPIGFEEGTAEETYTVTTLRMLEEVIRGCSR